jgi:hypothetical protein
MDFLSMEVSYEASGFGFPAADSPGSIMLLLATKILIEQAQGIN